MTTEVNQDYKNVYSLLGVGKAIAPSGHVRSVDLSTYTQAAHCIIASPAVNTTANSATYGWQHFAEGEFFGIRLALRNYGADTLGVTLMKCAPAPTHLNDGAALTWTSVTFSNGSVTGTIPAATGSGADTVPGILLSDVIYVKSVDRTDSPTFKPLLQTRVQLATNATVQNESSSVRHLSLFNDSAFANGRQLGSWVQSGDHVTSIVAKTMSATGSYWSAGVSVEFLYTEPVLSICAVGDSLIKGANSAGFISGMVVRAAFSLTDTYKLKSSASIYALSSQTTPATLATLKAIITAGLKPTFMILKNWSPNDTSASDAIMDNARFRLQDSIRLCRENKITPIILTSPPHNSTSSNARRVALNAWTMTLGEIVADIATGMEDPSSPGNLLPTYDAGDGLHYTDAGMAYAASIIVDAIRSYNLVETE